MNNQNSMNHESFFFNTLVSLGVGTLIDGVDDFV